MGVGVNKKGTRSRRGPYKTFDQGVVRTRRSVSVDFSKLSLKSLRKYVETFAHELPCPAADMARMNKDQLVSLVQTHHEGRLVRAEDAEKALHHYITMLYNRHRGNDGSSGSDGNGAPSRAGASGAENRVAQGGDDGKATAKPERGAPRPGKRTRVD